LPTLPCKPACTPTTLLDNTLPHHSPAIKRQHKTMAGVSKQHHIQQIAGTRRATRRCAVVPRRRLCGGTARLEIHRWPQNFVGGDASCSPYCLRQARQDGPILTRRHLGRSCRAAIRSIPGRWCRAPRAASVKHNYRTESTGFGGVQRSCHAEHRRDDGSDTWGRQPAAYALSVNGVCYVKRDRPMRSVHCVAFDCGSHDVPTGHIQCSPGNVACFGSGPDGPSCTGPWV